MAAPKPVTYQQTICEVLMGRVKRTSAQEIIKQVAAKRGITSDAARGPTKLAIKKLVEAKTIIQVKGVGASGSFKLDKKAMKQVNPTGKSYRTGVAKKALPKTMKTVKKVIDAEKKKAKKTPKPSSGAKKAPKPAAKKAAKKPAAKKAPAKKLAAKKAAKKAAPKKAPAAAAKKAKK